LDGALLLPQATLSAQERTRVAAADELSVVASALFDASFRAGLATVERHAPLIHRVGVPGFDAAAGPGSDLVVQNDTPFGILVHATVGGGSSPTVRVQLWGSPYWDVRVSPGTEYDVQRPGVQRDRGPGCRPRAGVAGFSIDVSRTLSADGTGTRTETVPSRYRVLDRITCRR
jgi:vancomycin resistance protein YoaR